MDAGSGSFSSFRTRAAQTSRTLAASIMTQQSAIERYKIEILSDDAKIALNASDKLAEIGGQEVLDFLISLLESDNVHLRNLAALALREIGDNQALEPLLKSINKDGKKNHRGTMVYALQTLDCSCKLPELFDLLFYGRFEVKMGVTTILDEQVFDFTQQDLINIKHKWEDIQMHPETSPEFEKTRDLLQDYVEGFLVYLEGQSE